MPYTNASLASVWLVICGLVAVAVSGAIRGPWLLLLLVLAVIMPALILRSPAVAIAGSRKRPLPAARSRNRRLAEQGEVELSGWENEGGAQS